MKKSMIVGVGTVVFTTLALLSRMKSPKPLEKYSEKWMELLSDSELDEEREKARLEYLKTGSRAIIDLFDEVIRKRRHGDENPGYPVPREHGWYLPNDD